MAPKLYKTDASPPVRSVFLTAEALGVKLEHVDINLANNDHLKPAFLKLNPQHTIPTLDDDGKIIWDSHAINIYLATKYGKDDSLYPKDPYKRAVIDQRLHFDSGVLFGLAKLIVKPIIYDGAKTVPQNIIDEVNQAYDFLEKFLEGHNWAAGDNVTLADFSLLSSITSLDVFVPISTTKFPKILAWIKRGQQLPYYGVNQKGLDDFKAFLQKLMA